MKVVKKWNVSRQSSDEGEYMGFYCPVCGERYKSVCRCRIGEMICPNGHVWYDCPVHGITHIPGVEHGYLHGVIPDERGCYCPKKKEIIRRESGILDDVLLEFSKKYGKDEDLQKLYWDSRKTFPQQLPLVAIFAAIEDLGEEALDEITPDQIEDEELRALWVEANKVKRTYDEIWDKIWSMVNPSVKELDMPE